MDNYVNKYRRAPVERNGVEYRETVCSSQDRCEVRLLVSYAVSNMLPGMDRVESKALLNEDWIRVSGGWFHAPEFN